MLSFKQLQEKKTKIKINPKKDEIVEGQKKKKDDSYLETNMKKRQAKMRSPKIWKMVLL